MAHDEDVFVDVVFDGPPGPTAGRFVECEDGQGRSIRAGHWFRREDGYWVLRIRAVRFVNPLFQPDPGKVTEASEVDGVDTSPAPYTTPDEFDRLGSELAHLRTAVGNLKSAERSRLGVEKRLQAQIDTLAEHIARIDGHESRFLGMEERLARVEKSCSLTDKAFEAANDLRKNDRRWLTARIHRLEDCIRSTGQVIPPLEGGPAPSLAHDVEHLIGRLKGQEAAIDMLADSTGERTETMDRDQTVVRDARQALEEVLELWPDNDPEEAPE